MVKTPALQAGDTGSTPVRATQTKYGTVAQLVEQWTENPRVGSSTLPRSTHMLHWSSRSRRQTLNLQSWVQIPHGVSSLTKEVTKNNKIQNGAEAIVSTSAYARVAQLARASGSYPEGCEFDPRPWYYAGMVSMVSTSACQAESAGSNPATCLKNFERRSPLC